MQFYDVKAREKVEIDDSKMTKKKFVRETKNGSTQTRYAVRAQNNGTNLTRFVTEAQYNELNVPEEN